MKRRHSIVYLIIFFLVTGYYYYYEVVEKTRKEAAEAEAKKVFHVQEDRIQALEILAKDKKDVRLNKNETEWRITEPIQSDTDKVAVDDLLRELTGLNSQREVTATPTDLKIYGLDDPELRVRFQAGDQWSEILLGGKTPVGDSHYAKLPDKPAVFLISGTGWNELNKGLSDLRKRELFSFESSDARAVKVLWQDGTEVDIEREKDSKVWKAPAVPDLKIKTARVENVLDQVQGLRAEGFLEDTAGSLAAHGLEPPQVTVTVRLKDDKEAALRLGSKNPDGKLSAISSQLPAVVQVEAGLLEDIPKNVLKFEDKSILGADAEEVTRVKWRLGETEGEAVRKDPKTWQVTAAKGEPKVLKESWRAKALLWNLGDAEYRAKLTPAPPRPEKPYASLDFFKEDKDLCSLAWEKPPENETDNATVWISSAGTTEAVVVEGKVLGTAAGDIDEIIQSGEGKSAP